MSVDYITVKKGKRQYRVSANSRQYYLGRGFAVVPEPDEAAGEQTTAAETAPETDKPVKPATKRPPKHKPTAVAADGATGGGGTESEDGGRDGDGQDGSGTADNT